MPKPNKINQAENKPAFKEENQLINQIEIRSAFNEENQYYCSSIIREIQTKDDWTKRLNIQGKEMSFKIDTGSILKCEYYSIK